jgi:putative endonuclease
MFVQVRLNLLESAVNALYRAAEGRQTRRSGHLATGLRGERAAFFWLRRRGYTVVARNWRSSRVRGDLDLVAWDGDELCFIEVKTRTTRAVAAAEAAVDLDKRRVLRRLARHYLRQLPKRGVPARFDVLSIYFESGKAPDFEYFPGAFGWVEAQR